MILIIPLIAIITFIPIRISIIITNKNTTITYFFSDRWCWFGHRWSRLGQVGPILQRPAGRQAPRNLSIRGSLSNLWVLVGVFHIKD